MSATAQPDSSLSDDSSESRPSIKENTDTLRANVNNYKTRNSPSGDSSRELGVTWKDLTVRVRSSEAAVHENVLSQFNILNAVQNARRKPELSTILDKSHGCVKPGEMLLVLGRPGSGCTTLLNLLANRRLGYESVTGSVHYGSLAAPEAKRYRGQIVMNTEDELFFPALTVGQTIDFATRLKTPAFASGSMPGNDKEGLRLENREFLLRSMGIEHTIDTKVGNEYVRGVSGGERKRVSIVECLATRGSIFCWDNSTRGLDASTALEYAKTIRTMTDVLGLASIVTLYQAGNGIYDLFDKVLVLDKGRQIYYGPMSEARPYMENLGFVCREGSNVADYLTGVTVRTERKIHPDYEHTFPRTAEAAQAIYEASDLNARMRLEYDYPNTDAARERTRLFEEAVSQEKHPRLSASSPWTVDLASQVLSCVTRQYQIIWGDKASFFLKQLSSIAMALISGSLFYNAPANSGGLFLKGGALFFALMFNALQAMSEVTDSFTGRPVLLKHKHFGFFHPAAFCIAQIAADIPIIICSTTSLSVVLYFMVGLTTTASAFFTFWVVLFATSMAMTAAFRFIGAAFSEFGAASAASGVFVMFSILYSGYMIRFSQMHPWFGWTYWINPLSYGFDAVMSNEFAGTTVPCVGANIVPLGAEYTDPAHMSCAGVPGLVQGETSVSGDAYLAALSYSGSHIWRNFGILWAWWALFAALTILCTMRWKSAAEGGSPVATPRELVTKTTGQRKDEEAQPVPESSAEKRSSQFEAPPPGRQGSVVKRSVTASLVRNTSVFTWKNLSYTVSTPGGPRKLLDDVQGWVKPGMLGALMGSSGAGKTTLLDVLAQRKTEGTINGSIMVDGRPLPVSFQRMTGYCEQLDVHEPYATVREALEFSALLRQPRDVPRQEKLDYVNIIIDLLELNDLADTLIGTVGAGLTVEQRKRVTIGVELVSKPSILIFLDEPTSGLDGQSAFNTVRFLRKLADVGQAILVTIHQPSAQLFAQFDSLLLLAKGGKTVYFGDIGDNAATIKDYFARQGVPFPVDANPAEHMIDIVSGHLSQGRDWNSVWLSSPEHAAVTKELETIISTAASEPPATLDDGREFATSPWEQTRLVTQRMNVSLYRNTEYVNGKLMLHVMSALVNGFSFWMIGDSVGDLQLRLFTIFNVVFVAPGVINQLQPLFIARRDLFEAREKKSKMYSWAPFVTGLIISEMPYLCVCGVLYFVCWYYAVGSPVDSSRAGATFFMILVYEFLYTGIGQFVAAYAPTVVFASLLTPSLVGILVSFAGVLAPYEQIVAFWRYWLYWMNPLNYFMGGMLVFGVWGTPVICDESEFAIFDPPASETCGAYLASYMQGAGAASYLANPDATSACKVCQYSNTNSYLQSVNLLGYEYGWRNAGICVLFVVSSYGLVYGLMKLRTKRSKRAE
ncbi:brefeldin A resistance protein [Microdochium trichocladiopsis]|uniref:Brefeldin A resistance protein n=1 Tax=Microdochium trichocladiopsis TaxID=1682393 RepID=A0A9P9BLT6_9PEZI|nr:brefeldin A resistance protein [Microdochium trichocladiopsis]KAH7024760.1 brefeldin A resistance protein [Microdochium trichocladiopsis]